MTSNFKKIFSFVCVANLGILLLYLNYPANIHSVSQLQNSSVSQSESCEFQYLEKAEQVAHAYLKTSFEQRMPIYNKCSLNETDTRIEILITYTAQNKTYKVSLDVESVERRTTQKIDKETTKCYIQFFNKKKNSSESGQQVEFDEKQYLNSEFEVDVNKTGFFYTNCVNKQNKLVYHDVFTLLPQNMSILIEERLKYKKIVDEFRREKMYPILGDLVQNADYTTNCALKKSISSSLSRQPNILVLGLDSVSYANFKRVFPSTFKFLNEELANNVILDHVNSVAGSTIDNLIPMLTGLNYGEMVGKIDKKFDATFCDYLPYVLEDFESKGYLTMLQEDLPSIGIFNYLRDGFRYVPTHLYDRGYWLQLYNIRENQKGYCHYKRPSYAYWLEQIELFVEQMNLPQNAHIPYVSFNWLTEYTHDFLAVPPIMDLAIRNFLKGIHLKGYLDNTMLIFMTDHGNKLVSYAATESGKVERILPLLSIKLPDTLVNTRYHANLLGNKKKLVSAFDVYKSLNHFLFINNYDLNETDPFCTTLFRESSLTKRQLRGISIFEEIPEKRSCTEALIPVAMCGCFKAVDLDEPQFQMETKHSFQAIGAKTLDYVNNLTVTIKEKCVPYNVSSVNNFKKVFYSDKKIVYSGQIMLQPGDALFQLNFKMSSDLSFVEAPLRLSKYGDQSRCITDRHLQNYCFCHK